MDRESLDSWRARLREQQPAEPGVGKEQVIVQSSSPSQGEEPAGSNATPAGGTSSSEGEDADLPYQRFTPAQEEVEDLTGKQEGEPAAEGGSIEGEELDSWRKTSGEQQPAESDVGKEVIIAHPGSSTEDGEPAESDAAPDGGTLSPEEEDAERSLQAQVASFAELEKLTRENREALEGIRRLVGKPTAGGSSPRTDFTNEDKLQELDRLVAMAKALGEMTLRHMEDKDIQRRERALHPGSKAYYIAIRTGLGNAYLAASVVASSLVRTSKTGGMGMAGEALKVLSSAVPVAGGLASIAAAALKAGDRHIQTGRVVKITEMATDANECCSLARTLALRLADSLATDTFPAACTVDEPLLSTMAGVDGRGGYGWDHGVGALADDANEETVMEWFSGEVANDAGNNIDARKGSSEEQAGRRLGKRHLQKLLVAVGRGCLSGTNTAEEKVERLLKVITPEARARRVTTPSAPEKPFVRSPLPAPPHDGGLDQGAMLAAMQARLDALESDKKRLESEVDTLKKHISKPQAGPSGAVDAGGGQLFLQKQEAKTKTKEDFWQEAENTGECKEDHHPVTQDQMRELKELVDEKFREQDGVNREVQGALDVKKDKRRGRR